MKTVKRVTLIIILFAALIIGSSCFVVTNEDEYSLIRQFGKVDHVVDTAGVSSMYANDGGVILVV